MAESSVTIEKSVEDLEKEITCAICHEHYTDPKVLPCCHYYCKQCIHKLAIKTGVKKPLACPECRKTTSIPEGGVESLPTAFFISRLKAMHSYMLRAQGKVQAKCELCINGKAEGFCRQCAQFICDRCIESHKVMKMFLQHKTVTLEELREGGNKEIVLQEPSFQSCKLHKEPMKVYCFDCCSLICRDCTIKDHRDHNYEFISVAAPDKKRTILQQLEPLRAAKKTLSGAVAEVNETKSDISSLGHSLAHCIESNFDELYNFLDGKKKELLADVDKKVSLKVERLSVQEKGLYTTSAYVQSVIDYIEQCLQHSEDDVLMCIYAEIQSRIDKEIEAYENEGRNIAPVEDATFNIKENFAEDLKQLYRNEVKISEYAVTIAVCGKRARLADINKRSEILVSAYLPNGKPARRPCNVEGQLKLEGKDTITKCQVDRVQSGKYVIRYTPTVRGHHQLSITANDQEISGSPLSVFVSGFSESFSCISAGLNKVRDVTVTQADEIIVAVGPSLVMFDANGDRLKSYTGSSVASICSVAYDSKAECVYAMGGIDTTKIMRFDLDLKMLESTEMCKNSPSNHSGIEVVEDGVMVCDNKRMHIKLYTKELTFKGYFGSRNGGPWKCNHMRGISLDKHGRVYVSDAGKSCIHVFGTNGEYSCSIGRDADGVNRLSKPAGISTAGNYIFVADNDNHCVVVYTTEGEHIDSFGQHGSKKGEFNNPRGLCVDKGFVYVCDYSNNRVQIF